MRSFWKLVFLFAALIFATKCGAAEFKLLNGDVIKGEGSSFNDNGVIIRLELGGFSQRIGYGKFTQETLRDLAQTPAAKKFVEPFIEIPQEEKAQKAKAIKKAIVIREPNKIPLYTGRPSLASAFFTPVGLLLLLALYAANLYAAYEISHFRARPVPVVVGASAILPIIAPVAFLAMPPGERAFAEAETPAEAPAPIQADAKGGTAPASGLGLAAGHDAAAAKPRLRPGLQPHQHLLRSALLRDEIHRLLSRGPRGGGKRPGAGYQSRQKRVYCQKNHTYFHD